MVMRCFCSRPITIPVALRRARQVGEIQGRHPEQRPRPLRVGGGDDRRIDPENPVPWTLSRSRIVRGSPPGFIPHALHEYGRGNDWDFPERIEREKIGVAGDDQIGMAVDSQLQKFVVLRITTGGDSVGDRDQLGRRQALHSANLESAAGSAAQDAGGPG